MSRIVVEGGNPLFGEVSVSGSKNAALPVIFASLITHGVSVIRSLPDISDVNIALKIIESFGARITVEGDTAYIDTTALNYTDVPKSYTSAIRASTYLIGATLSRFGRAKIGSYGGCSFSDRPIDMHISAAIMFGASLFGDELTLHTPHGANVVFDKVSVGATVNSLLMASAIPQTSHITPYAKEPPFPF